MIRRSISQIFHSDTPHEQQSCQQDNTMFSSLQPSRPKVPPSHSTSQPLNQQPTRNLSSTPTSAATSTPRYLSPRNQIEAMPPPLAPMPTTLVLGHPQQQFLSALRHPVFFTDRFMKAPTGVNAGGGTTPVATGYVYNDGLQRSIDSSARL